jgi:Ca2+-transporting ATPase
MTPTDTPERAWHALDSGEVCEALTVDPTVGLNAGTVDERRAEHGPNRLEEEQETPAWVHLLNQFRSPLIIILLVAGAVTALLGEYIDTGVIAAVLVLNAAIGFTQERKAEQSVRALAELAAPDATVVRGGEERQIDAEELVPGDVVLLEMGARIAADARVLDAQRLGVDESLLTGDDRCGLVAPHRPRRRHRDRRQRAPQAAERARAPSRWTHAPRTGLSGASGRLSQGLVTLGP